jgi:hypothetical protein
MNTYAKSPGGRVDPRKILGVSVPSGQTDSTRLRAVLARSLLRLFVELFSQPGLDAATPPLVHSADFSYPR